MTVSTPLSLRTSARDSRIAQAPERQVDQSTAWVGWGTIDSLNSAFNGKRTWPSGVGSVIAVAHHCVPADVNDVPPVCFEREFDKARGARPVAEPRGLKGAGA